MELEKSTVNTHPPSKAMQFLRASETLNEAESDRMTRLKLLMLSRKFSIFPNNWFRCLYLIARVTRGIMFPRVSFRACKLLFNDFLIITRVKWIKNMLPSVTSTRRLRGWRKFSRILITKKIFLTSSRVAVSISIHTRIPSMSLRESVEKS